MMFLLCSLLGLSLVHAREEEDSTPAPDLGQRDVKIHARTNALYQKTFRGVNSWNKLSCKAFYLKPGTKITVERFAECGPLQRSGTVWVRIGHRVAMDNDLSNEPANSNAVDIQFKMPTQDIAPLNQADANWMNGKTDGTLITNLHGWKKMFHQTEAMEHENKYLVYKWNNTTDLAAQAEASNLESQDGYDKLRYGCSPTRNWLEAARDHGKSVLLKGYGYKCTSFMGMSGREKAFKKIFIPKGTEVTPIRFCKYMNGAFVDEQIFVECHGLTFKIQSEDLAIPQNCVTTYTSSMARGKASPFSIKPNQEDVTTNRMDTNDDAISDDTALQVLRAEQMKEDQQSALRLHHTDDILRTSYDSHETQSSDTETRASDCGTETSDSDTGSTGWWCWK